MDFPVVPPRFDRFHAKTAERKETDGPDRPRPAAPTALCRGDAALATLIRVVAAVLERQGLVLNDAMAQTAGAEGLLMKTSEQRLDEARQYAEVVSDRTATFC